MTLLEPGTLERPGPYGRLVRLALGVLCAYVVLVLFWHAPAIIDAPVAAMVRNVTLWLNEEYVFTIAGVRAVVTYKKMRAALDIRLGSELKMLGELDVDSLDYKQLRQWSQWSDRIDTYLNDARAVLEDCRRFLMPSNIAEINKYKRLLWVSNGPPTAKYHWLESMDSQ